MALLDILLLAIPVAIALIALLFARPASGGPGELLGLRSAQDILASREALEAEDLDQLLEASNARRRRRGEPERTVEELELEITADAVSRGGRAGRPGSGPSLPR